MFTFQFLNDETAKWIFFEIIVNSSRNRFNVILMVKKTRLQ